MLLCQLFHISSSENFRMLQSIRFTEMTIIESNKFKLLSLLIIRMIGQFENPSKLAQYLSVLKKFPDESRKAILISALQLPKNYKHLTQLCQPPVPLVEHTTDRDTCSLVSTVIKLDPSLNIQWLPGVIYPFAKLFKKDLLAQFQISLSFLYNWAICWFKDYPTPSTDISDFMAQQLPELNDLVRTFGAQFSSFIWPMFLVNFTDILNKSDWLQLFDFVLTNPNTPQYLICCITSIIKSLESYLLKATSIEQMHRTLRKQRRIDISSIIKSGVALAKRSKSFFSQLYKNRVFPLPSPQYPIINFIENGLNFTISNYNSPQFEQLQSIQKVINRFQFDKKWESPKKEYQNQVEFKKLQKGSSLQVTKFKSPLKSLKF